MADAPTGSTARYEPDERHPIALTLGSGLQSALVVVAPARVEALAAIEWPGGEDESRQLAVCARPGGNATLNWPLTLFPRAQ